MSKVKFSLLVVIALYVISCKENAKEQIKAEEVKKEISGITLPGIPFEIRNKLRNEVTFVDYTWFNLPISISQGVEDGVKTNVEFISEEVPSIIPSTCKPVAHKYFSINGEIYMDIDVYFSNGCFFYLFLENNKPKYANLITEQGINFYTQITGQSSGVAKKIKGN